MFCPVSGSRSERYSRSCAGTAALLLHGYSPRDFQRRSLRERQERPRRGMAGRTTLGADVIRAERIFGIERVNEAAWRSLEPPDFPFFDFEFLRALERSGSVGDASGWSPVYLVCKDE